MRSSNVIPLIPPGKLLCFITGHLRNDTPEENVRQRWARALVEEYGYPKSDLGLETTIKMGRSIKKCDITVFRHGYIHSQENILACIEVKRDDAKANDAKNGDGQLISYMSACPARYGLWVGQDMRAFEKVRETEIIRAADIPRFGDDVTRRPKRTDLRSAHELTSVFKRCHNYIHANGGLQKAEAFHELLKLIFCKAYDEQEGGIELDFSISPSEKKTISGQTKLLNDKLIPLFINVKRSYPFIFLEDETIKLEPSVAAYVVSELQFISILGSSTDVKGEAYETLVGANLRGDRGEYFTPRNVCEMTVKIIMRQFDTSEITQLKVIDCCCGTGGFLVAWLDNLRNNLMKQENARGTANPLAAVRQRIKDICARNLYGTDINPFLVRTAQMNLVMHGDGSTNVHKLSSLQRPGEWSEAARNAIPFGSMDVVITNPPFGGEVKIDDPHILSQYQLADWYSASRRNSLPAEQLFIEAGMNFLKPGGYMGVVIPDGILNNPSLAFLRDWILKRSRIIASIALPKETFGRNGGVNNPSVLIVRKFTQEEYNNAQKNIIDTDQRIFMVCPKTTGIDRRGKPVYLRYPDGRLILDAQGNRIVDDQIAWVPHAYEEWLGDLQHM